MRTCFVWLLPLRWHDSLQEVHVLDIMMWHGECR